MKTKKKQKQPLAAMFLAYDHHVSWPEKLKMFELIKHAIN